TQGVGPAGNIVRKSFKLLVAVIERPKHGSATLLVSTFVTMLVSQWAKKAIEINETQPTG
ncbi:MAG: hypothetical protein ACXU9A_19360, partial [Xanthobacteraceae bacterium]